MSYDPYRQLGLTNKATDEEIRKAYKSLCQIHHPDKNPDDPYAETRFKLIKEAYEILMDPDRRARAERGESTTKFDPHGSALGVISAAVLEELQKQGHTDIIQNVRKNIKHRNSQNHQALANAQKMTDGLTATLDKFEFHGNGLNIIAETVRQQLKKVEESRQEAENNKASFELALLMLDDYEDLEDLALGYVTVSTSTGTTSW